MDNTASLFSKNATKAAEYMSDRRGFMKAGLFFTAALGFWTPALAQAAETARRVSMVNAHTGEKFSGEYWRNGRYLPDAFNEIKTVMRDHRTGDRFPIDPRLIDILYVLDGKMKTGKPFDIVSGYRSLKTNTMLRRRSEGVARNSLHMSGQAVDLRMYGSRLTHIRDSAVGLKAGGVGFYPKSNFVHIDTGRVRTW